MSDAIDRFSGPHRFLSNFYPSPIIYDGVAYPTVEHAYQAQKTLDEWDAGASLRCPTPAAPRGPGGRCACAATGRRSSWASCWRCCG